MKYFKLMILMYHHVLDEMRGFSPDVFEKHLRTLASNYKIVGLGEPLDPTQLSLCLTFDDGFYDFYHYVFPLLKELKVKAVLGVSTKFILDQFERGCGKRFDFTGYDGMLEENYKKGVFCTWQECKEMIESGWVSIASHSHTHPHLTTDSNYQEELLLSKSLIEKNTGKKVEALIYPFGDTSSKVHHFAKEHYPYTMRIGSALNRDWHRDTQLLYRVDAENFWPQNKLWSKKDEKRYMQKFWVNRILAK